MNARRLLVLPVLLLVAPAASAQTQVAKLVAADGGSFDDFAQDLDLSGDSLVVGARFDDDFGSESGSAYVFRDRCGVWTQEAKLLASDAQMDDRFGDAVAIDVDTVVVGAFEADGVVGDAGAAYVFVRSGTTWSQEAKLVASDGADGDRFGISVAVDGDTALVGSFGAATGGAAYVFVRGGTSWTQQAKLVPADGASGDDFGQDVAVDGDLALIGARNDDDAGVNSGSAYVFQRSGTTWSQQAKLVPADGAAGASFGDAVDLDAGSAAIGALNDDSAAFNSGSVYVFTTAAGVWTQEGKLVASDGAANDSFGLAVSVDGLAGLVVVGAPFDDDLGTRTGSVYVFSRSGTTWTETAKRLGSDTAVTDELGTAVAADGATFAVGAPRDDDVGVDSGSVYVFDTGGAGGSLGASPTTLSVSAGGVQTMTLNAGPSFGGQLYWLAGTFTGTSPGITILGANVPLNPDSYFNRTVLAPNTGPFTNNAGTLNVLGSATVPLTVVPASDPALAGLVLDHAFVVVGQLPISVLHVSNTTCLCLTG